MSQYAKNCVSTVMPCLRYRDAPAAIEWLCSVIGFEKKAVYPNPDGTIAHAQLTFGNGMIMLGSAQKADSEWGQSIKQPDEVGGYETQSPYLIAEDADVIYNKVRAAGGEIVIDIKDEDYGGRGFSFHDLEGHLWTVGTYNPW